MTGMSARSVGSTKIRYDFVALSDLIHNALEELGHEVDRRVVGVDPRDTLDEYDRALVLVNWASSLSSMHVHEAALALMRLGDRARLYVDDWRTESLADDLAYHVRRDEGWERQTQKWTARAPSWQKLGDQMEPARQALLSIIDPRGPRLPLLAPIHPWGDPTKWDVSQKARLEVQLRPFDPSPMVTVPDVPRPSERARSWVLATLQNHDRWVGKLGASWPVVQLGGAKKAGGGVRMKGMSPVVPERQVVEAYAANRGMLVAPYACAGSGWWRPRYTFALGVGAVCYVGADEDANAIADSFNVTLEDLEAMDNTELDYWAAHQKEDFEAWQPTYEETLRTLEASIIS